MNHLNYSQQTKNASCSSSSIQRHTHSSYASAPIYTLQTAPAESSRKDNAVYKRGNPADKARALLNNLHSNHLI